MGNTHRGRGPSRRIIVAALAVAALPLTSAATLTGAATAAPIDTPSTVAAKPSTAVAAAPALYYATVTSRSGGMHTLSLVNRKTGKVVRTLASSRTIDWQRPFTDVDVATDGTVYAVVREVSTRYKPYASKLVRYRGGKAVTVLPYVISARLSPNEQQLAVTVLSPDGNKDGKGSQSLRVVSTSGKLVRTLATRTFPVDKQGWPMQEVGGQRVAGWLNPSTLIVGDGCCDSGTVSIVSATKPSTPNRWPSMGGDGSLQAIGTIGNHSVLVARIRLKGDGVKVPLETVGLEALTMTAARPRGRVVDYVADDSGDLNRHVDRFVARAKATPLVIGSKRFPYRGRGTVLAAYL